MAYRRMELGTLVRLDRDEAKRKILEAHALHGGNTSKAAPVLGCSRRHVVRLIRDLALAPSIARMRRDARHQVTKRT